MFYAPQDNTRCTTILLTNYMSNVKAKFYWWRCWHFPKEQQLIYVDHYFLIKPKHLFFVPLLEQNILNFNALHKMLKATQWSHLPKIKKVISNVNIFYYHAKLGNKVSTIPTKREKDTTIEQEEEDLVSLVSVYAHH